jgi:hypothetical protein
LPGTTTPRTAGVDDRAERVECRAAQRVGEVHELHGEPHIGPVDPVPADRLFVGHARDRGLRERLAPELLEDLRVQGLERGHDVLAVHERHLEVELGVLVDAVGARILVAIAMRDLEVLVDPGHHEDLLVLLR